MSGHPAPNFCVEEKPGQHSRNESFPQIGVRVHSSLPVRPVSEGRLGLPCVGVDGLELERSHAACLPWKHMKESCVCLAVKKREKGRWQLSRGWLTVKCSLFLALSPSSYLKTRYWRSIREREGGSNKKKKKCCLYPANAVFPGVMLKRHRGPCLCLCFVSVISGPLSIITWQLIPPGGGFWLLIYLYESGIGFLVLRDAQLNIWTNLQCPTLHDPVQTNLVLGTVALPAFIMARLLFLFLLYWCPAGPLSRWDRGRQRQKVDEKSSHHAILCSIKPLFFL